MELEKPVNNNLNEIAKRTRELVIRSIFEAKSGHPGGSLSAIEQLVILHYEIMQPQPNYHPDRARDIFILSGGHKVPSLYAVWAVLGWIQPEDVLTLRQLSSPFQGHPSYPHIDWLHCSSGSLGVAYAQAVGMALGRKLIGQPGKVFVLIGDGDLQEGITTEASRLASFYELDNLCVILDWNKKTSDGYSIMLVNPYAEFTAWGFQITAVNGHNFDQLRQAFRVAQETKGKPTAIIAGTIKAKGVKSWEERPDGMHGSVCLSDEDLAMALRELEEN